MKADALPLLKILQGGRQYEIPIYQRTYSWLKPEYEQLWRDVIQAGMTGRTHFTGSVVYVTTTDDDMADVAQALVIDGQQRLTTTVILLLALVRRLRQTGEFRVEREGSTVTVSAQSVRNTTLVNENVQGRLHHKLVLTQGDRDTLARLLDDLPLPEVPAPRIMSALTYFEEQLAQPGTDLSTVYAGIQRLQIVRIALKQGEDDPQLIFESMNSTGKDLAQADLIRNYVLMGLPNHEQQELYEGFWLPMERLLGVTSADTVDRFMRDYLTFKTRAIPNQSRVYQAFKDYRSGQSVSMRELIADVHSYAQDYARLLYPAQESHPGLREALSDLLALEVKVAYPFLMEVLADQRRALISEADTARIVRYVEAFVLRRAVCGVPTNTLNKTFAVLARDLDKTAYVRSLELTLMSLPGAQYFPGDEEFQRELAVKPLYGMDVCKFVLGRLENFGQREHIVTAPLTIEHVLPQNKNLSQPWRAMLGEDWAATQTQLVHTLGNLTLSAYNSELGDKPFGTKKTLEYPKGYLSSKVQLTRDVAAADVWDADAIMERGRRLARTAVSIWPQPKVTTEELAAVQAKVTSRRATLQDGQVTVEDRLALLPHGARAVLDELERRVLTLGPNIERRVMKWFLSYRLAKGFCEVQARKDSFYLWIRLPDAGQWNHHGQWQLTRHTHWWKRQIHELADVDDSWPVVMAAYDYGRFGKGATAAAEDDFALEVDDIRELVWQRIESLAGETFQQKRGGEFTYQLAGRTLVLSTTNQQLAPAQVEEALGLMPLESTKPLQHLRGPSYLYAVLMDERIREGLY